MIASLMERYRSLLSKRKTKRPAADPDLNRTYLQLYQAQREHYFIDVEVDGDDVLYQSMILELDPEDKTMLIDELFPTGFDGLPGQKVKVSIRQPKGRKIKFNTEILEQHQHDDAPVYVLSMPEKLKDDQRRKAYRLPIGQGIKIEPEFIGPDRQSYLAKLRDVSSAGLGLEVMLEDPDRFRFNDLLSHVAFDFAGTNIDCDMKVRNVAVQEDISDEEAEPSKVWIGAEFVDLPVEERRMLERSIMRIQRDRLRLAGDVENQLTMA